jgi:hypothetical protein
MIAGSVGGASTTSPSNLTGTSRVAVFNQSLKNTASNVLGNPVANQEHSWVPDFLYNKMPTEARSMANGMAAVGRAVGGDAVAHTVSSIATGNTPAEWANSPKQAGLDVATTATMGVLRPASKGIFSTIDAVRNYKNIYNKYNTIRRGTNAGNALFGNGDNAVSPLYNSTQFGTR